MKVAMLAMIVLLLGMTAVACWGAGEVTPTPPEGWCCLDGEVSSATEAECLEGGGRFFLSQGEAEDYCRGEMPLEGWCCLNGEVFPATEVECLEGRGRFFFSQGEAEDYCRREMPLEGWCCLNGEVFPVIEAECSERGGRFFLAQGEAEDYCRRVPGQPRISDLKGPDWGKYVGEEVTVEAIFVRDPLPMLVTDLDIVRRNMPMPDDQYILLVGGESEEIDPRRYGGAKLKLNGIVVEIADVSKYGDEYVAIRSISYEMLERLEVYSPEIARIETYPEIQQPHRYAILFSGGIGPSDNHLRYWNDLKFMYSTLINEYGFTNETIAILYADGKALDNQMPVHYSATQANLETVFNLLRKVSTTQDLIFMFTTNHGGGFEKDDLYQPITKNYSGRFDADGDEGAEALDEKKYNRDLNGDGKIQGQVSWDEELCSWGGSIFDDSFDTIFANLKYDRMIIVMEQCFSGGLIADMARSGGNKIIISAAGEFEPSWAMDPAPYYYDEFSYYFTCAINGADPNGKTVNADANNDGEVSMVEAFNYARTHDTQNETPWYEDSGDGVPHSGNMPAGGDGTLGSNTSLE